MNQSILSLFGVCLLIVGCSSQRQQRDASVDMSPMPMAANVEIQMLRAASNISDSDTLFVAPPAPVEIHIQCPYTSGYVYLSVSTDLINWQPFDGTIYDASLPQNIDDAITNFVRADLPQRFAKYQPTNWMSE